MPGLEPEPARPAAAARRQATLRIVFFAAQHGRVSNGVGTYATALVEGLARAGHRVTLITAHSSGGRTAVASSVRVREVSSHAMDPSPGRWLSLARAFAREAERALREERPDLLHFADAREALFTAPAGVPIVGSVHDDYAASAPRNPFALARLHPDPWSRAAYYALLRRLERRAYAKLDLLIANSQAVARSLGSAYRIARARLAVAYPSIPPSPPIAPGEKLPGEPAVLFVGTNFFRKGLATLLEAAAELRHRLPKLTITVAGGDPRRARAESLTERLSLNGRVRFLGHRDRREVLELYGRADLLAMPSHTEGFGLVFLEAMRAGIPVIGGRRGGTPELVRDGVDGLLVPPGDVAALVSAIERLHGDPALRARLASAGLSRVRSFSLDASLAQTMDAYHRVLERRPAR